jgi:hypothetical protein
VTTRTRSEQTNYQNHEDYSRHIDEFDGQKVPEPGMLLMFSTGLLGHGFFGRKTREINLEIVSGNREGNGILSPSFFCFVRLLAFQVTNFAVIPHYSPSRV